MSALTASARSRETGPMPRPPLQLLVCALLLVATTVGWRRGEYFTGSLDPVVVAKGALSVAALLMAFLMVPRGARYRTGTGSLWALAVLLAVTAFGALTYDQLLAGGVLIVRLTILALTVFLLLRVFSTEQFFTAVAWSCGGVAAAATITGRDTISSGRLSGGMPEIDPNELALLACIVVLYVAWQVVLGRLGVFPPIAAVVALGIVWATGSRTALLMLLPALVVMALHARRARVGLVVGGLGLASLAGLVLTLHADALAGFLERDAAEGSTLDSRYIAWDAATRWADDTWQLLFGGGLSVKIIRVQGQYWETQPLDSSWFSLVVQAGILGTLLAGLWALWSLRGSLHAPRPQRALFLGTLVFVLGRSIFESGLFDATPAFLLLIAVSLLAEGGSRRRLPEELGDDGAPAVDPPPPRAATPAPSLAG
jgi:hypothetical protein